MRDGRTLSALLTALCVAMVLQVGALAHSSFIWDTAARPVYVLPFAFVLSVAIEYSALTFIAHVKRPWKTFAVVLAGNVLAFGAAAAFYLYSNRNEPAGWAWPPYIIGGIFLVASFLVEVLIEAAILHKDAGKLSKVVWTLLIANAATGGIAAAAERLICTGHWSA